MFETVARSATASEERPSPVNSMNLFTTPFLRKSSVSVSTRSVAVALILALEVALVDVLRAEEVGLDRVVDDQVDRDEGLDLRGVFPGALHRGAHRCEIDRRGDAGVVLEKDAARTERDRGVISWISLERFSCLLLRIPDHPPDALEEDLHGDGKGPAIVDADEAVGSSV